MTVKKKKEEIFTRKYINYLREKYSQRSKLQVKVYILAMNKSHLLFMKLASLKVPVTFKLNQAGSISHTFHKKSNQSGSKTLTKIKKKMPVGSIGKYCKA